MVRADLDAFVETCMLNQRKAREESERFRSFSYDELIRRDKTNWDIFWLKDESLEQNNNLSTPDILAAEIIRELETALISFRKVELQLRAGV